MKARTLTVALLVLAVPLAAAVAAESEEWKAPADAGAKKNPLKDDEATVAAGRAIYEKKCKGCHGDAGKGDGKASAYLKVKPADLTAEDIRKDPDGELFWKVTTGRRPMPGFEKQLTEEERWQVIKLVRSLAPKPADDATKGAASGH